MSFESPFSVLHDSKGIEIAVSQSQALDPNTGGSQTAGLLIAVSSAFGEGAQFIKSTNDGAIFITGTLAGISVDDGLIVDQGVHGDASSSWYVVLTDGTSSAALGSSTTNPIFVTGTLSISQSCNLTSVTANVPAVQEIATLDEINEGRKGLFLYYNGNKTAFIKLGNSASQTDFTVRMSARSYYEVPGDYCGIVTATWNAAGGTDNFMMVTEVTE